jgi:hypothetical protein
MKVNNPNGPKFPIKVISQESEREIMNYLFSAGWELRGGYVPDEFPFFFKKFEKYDKKYYWDWY